MLYLLAPLSADTSAALNTAVLVPSPDVRKKSTERDSTEAFLTVMTSVLSHAVLTAPSASSGSWVRLTFVSPPSGMDTVMVAGSAGTLTSSTMGSTPLHAANNPASDTPASIRIFFILRIAYKVT